MKKTIFNQRSCFRFRRLSRKRYALFAVVGREVLIGTLSVATLTHAKAEGISVDVEQAGDMQQRKELSLGEVVVTGSRAPLTQAEAAKIVSVITRDDIHRAAAESVNDVLKMATGVDVRQRGGFGVQTDISINGGTFDQIAVLLNGVNISNPQTGHLSADFPVSLDDIERIEIIEGAASRIYGASAFRGAINIVTSHSAPAQGGGTAVHGTVNVEGGSYGTFGGGACGSLVGDRFASTLSAGYRQSDGGTDNSYFRQSRAFYQGSVSLGSSQSLSFQLGMSTKRYGANTFYSAAYPDQYESNARIFASATLNCQLSAFNLKVTPYWNRNLDHFQLVRGSAFGENFHRNDVLGASFNVSADWALGRTSLGSEIRREKIVSTNLGVPMAEEDYIEVARHDGVYYNKRCARTDFNMFLEHNVLLKRFTASMGVVANRNTGYNDAFRLYPGIDLSYRPIDGMKLTASWNMGFRMPTFTDLFYKSPTLQGNVGLKPEKTQSLRLSARYAWSDFSVQLTGFYDWGTDMIDWVMYAADDTYHSANFSLDNRGCEVNVEYSKEWGRIRLGYAYIDQERKDDVQIFKSNYAMEYLRHKFVCTIDHRIVSALTAQWSFRWQQRMGSYVVYEDNKPTGISRPYHPYGLIDLKLQWVKPRYELALTMNNLTSYRYHDHGNVLQPGFWLMAGAKVRF
jgi:iron complex outermembrane receptor protein